MPAWFPNEGGIEEALAGAMSAQAVVVDLARHYVIPVSEELVGALKADDGHERLIDPGVAAGVVGRLLR